MGYFTTDPVSDQVTDHEGWRLFWLKRQDALRPHQLTPFHNNFACMVGILASRFNAKNRKAHELSVLEVGAGRGTMSELFRQKGFNTFCTDIENRLIVPLHHTFVQNDILE